MSTLVARKKNLQPKSSKLTLDDFFSLLRREMNLVQVRFRVFYDNSILDTVSGHTPLTFLCHRLKGVSYTSDMHREAGRDLGLSKKDLQLLDLAIEGDLRYHPDEVSHVREILINIAYNTPVRESA